MERRQILTALGAGVSAGIAGCADGSRSDPGGGSGTGTSLSLSATPFDDGEPIPARYTCDGENVSPELSVSGVVDEIASLALVVDDPDAPGNEPFVHWLLWNVPASTETIPRGVGHGETVPPLGGANQGTNDAGAVGYSGPCPPPGDGAHAYRFHLFGLDEPLEVAGGASRSDLQAGMEGHIVDDVVLTGTYERD